MDQRDKLKQAYAAAVVFSILVGFSFLAIKTCILHANTLQILVWRYNWAVLCMLLLLAFRVFRLELKNKSKRNLMLTAGFYIAFIILQTIGLIFSTSVESAIIFAMIPILSKIIAGIFLGEKSTYFQNIFVGISVAALIMMIVAGTTDVTANPTGIFILILSSLSMAISNVFMRYVRSEYKPVEITASICFMGVFAFNLALIIFGDIETYFEPLKYLSFIISTAYLGIPCTVVSALLVSFMLRYMPAVNAAIFGNLSTAISIVAGVVVLGEPLLTYHIICTLLIIISVIGVCIPDWKSGIRPGSKREVTKK